MALAALIVAIAAATVALLSFAWSVGWSVWQHRRLTRPEVKVRGHFGVIPGLLQGETIFGIGAANVGQVPVTLNGVSATAKGAASQLTLVAFKVQAPSPLPLTLGPGEKWDGMVDGEGFRAAIASLEAGDPPWEIRVAVKDAADGHYESEWIHIDRGPR